MPMRINPCILLTGAGFTHNFGGLLAKDMWSQIFNHGAVQTSQRLRSLLLDNTDFESVYHSVTSGDFSEAEKAAFHDAVSAVYGQLDRIVRDYLFTPGSAYPVNRYKVQNLIEMVLGEPETKGFLFTTNQDLFIERKYFPIAKPQLPGIQHRDPWFSSNFNQPVIHDDFVVLPSRDAIEAMKERFGQDTRSCYVKLHGSWNWTSAIRERQMVIGRAKGDQIAAEPLLQWYSELLLEILAVEGRRLLAIGYGFGDEHINAGLAKAIAEANLQLFVLTPVSIEDFKDMLLKRPFGAELLRGLRGFFPYLFREMFPVDQSITQQWLNIMEQFFGREINPAYR